MNLKYLKNLLFHLNLMYLKNLMIHLILMYLMNLLFHLNLMYLMNLMNLMIHLNPKLSLIHISEPTRPY